MFYPGSEAQAVEMLPGLTRRTLSVSEKMMLVEISIEEGVEVPNHDHPHDQVGYVLSGCLRLTIGDQVRECRPGDGYHAPPNVPHGAIALEPTVVIDVFSPPREDYR